MNLHEAKLIAQNVPDIVFEIALSRHGIGMATTGNIDLVESLANELPVVDSPIAGQEYVYIRAAMTKRNVL